MPQAPIRRNGGWHRARALALLAVVAAALAGCGIFGSDPPRPCPEFLILEQGGQLVRFRPGPGRDVTDVMFEARIVDFQGSCAHEDDLVDISLDMFFDVRRGPADTERRAAFEYFVAIPKFYPAKEGKRTFPVAIPFEGNRTRLIYRDRVEIQIPLKKDESGGNYEVYLGFQLSRDELDYNRQRGAQ